MSHITSEVLADQQQVADAFLALHLIPKPLTVSAAVASSVKP